MTLAGSSEDGWTLAELLIGLVLAVLILGSTVILLSRSARLMEGLVAQEESTETLRTIWTVLVEEVGVGAPGQDWALEPANDRALQLRAFRGLAVPCSWGAGSREGTVLWVGHREPDPGRDSVLVMDRDGLWHARALEATGAGEACAGPLSGDASRWRLGGPAGAWVLARYFERGRYSLEDGAFRYRRGNAGRQPLTPERVGFGSRFRLNGNGGLTVEVELEPGGMVRWETSGSLPPLGAGG